MKRNVVVRFFLVLLVAGIAGGGGYWFAMRRMQSSMSAPSAVPAGVPSADSPGKAEAATDRKVLFWHDPMIPGPKFDKPGKSPFMDNSGHHSPPLKTLSLADNNRIATSSCADRL